MNKKNIIVFFIILGFISSVFAQTEDKCHAETQHIVNAVINSSQFKKIMDKYSLPHPTFVANELLLKTYKIEYKNQRVSIVESLNQDDTYYWFLGHYVIDTTVDDPISATIQLALTTTKETVLLIGVRLHKGEDWDIEYLDTILDKLCN